MDSKVTSNYCIQNSVSMKDEMVISVRTRLRDLNIWVAAIVLLNIPLWTSAQGVPSGGRATITKRLEAFLAREFHPTQPGGVILVARKDKLIFRRAYGLADLELRVPLQTNSVFRIGSITKQFTAVAILKLVQAGRISLGEDVRAYVPNALSEGPKITIEQLLTHTSGLPNFVDLKEFDALSRQDHKTQDILQLTKHKPKLFAPGAGFGYSDTGYILLGAVIEHMTGMSYGDYLESQLFRPLGLNSTFYGDDERIILRRAKGYSFKQGTAINASYISMTVPHAAGGIVSTVDDLLRWDAALRKGTVVSRHLLDRAWSARTLPDGTASGYGFGWKACTFEDRRTIEHGGWINGFGSRAIRFPDDELNVIVLVNNDSDRPDAGTLARRTAGLVLTGSDKMPEHRLSTDEKKALIGRYRLSGGEILNIVERNGQLFYERGRNRPESLIALSSTQLSFAAGDRTFVISFEIGADGRANKVQATLTCEPAFKGERF